MHARLSQYLLAFTLAGSAQAATFTFESATPTALPRNGALTSYSETNAGLTLTITRPNNAFDLVSNTGSQAGKPAGWGLVSLDPFVDQTGSPFVADFSSPITNFSVQFGDYGADSVDTLVANFYAGAGGTGALIGTATQTFDALTFPDFATLTFSSGAPFQSVVFMGGTTDFPHSVFYDNFAAGGVPEPASWALMIAGFGLAGAAMRSRRVVRVAWQAA